MHGTRQKAHAGQRLDGNETSTERLRDRQQLAAAVARAQRAGPKISKLRSSARARDFRSSPLRIARTSLSSAPLRSASDRRSARSWASEAWARAASAREAARSACEFGEARRGSEWGGSRVAFGGESRDPRWRACRAARLESAGCAGQAEDEVRGAVCGQSGYGTRGQGTIFHGGRTRGGAPAGCGCVGGTRTWARERGRTEHGERRLVFSAEPLGRRGAFPLSGWAQRVAQDRARGGLRL